MVKLLNYTYQDAGFDAFMQRSLSSDPTPQSLSEIAMLHPQTNINYDQQQVSGNMGDVFKVGSITIDGKQVRIDGVDTNGNVVWRLGNLGD